MHITNINLLTYNINSILTENFHITETYTYKDNVHTCIETHTYTHTQYIYICGRERDEETYRKRAGEPENEQSS